MPQPLSLTARQAARPHMAVNDARTNSSLSVLERSFARASLAEIQYWEQKGVLDEALAGSAPSRREYTHTLMGHLLAGRRHGFWSADVDGWDAILRKLWDGGASAHVDKYPNWIHGLAGHWLFDVMLDAGTSPYGSGMFHNCAIDSLVHAVAINDAISEDGRPRFFAVSAADPALLHQQLERCIEFPTDNPTDLANFLASIVSRGIPRAPQNQPHWQRWRDRLLEKGANPLAQPSRVLYLMAMAGPGTSPIPRYDLRGIDPSVDPNMGQPPTEAEIKLSCILRAKRDAHWIQASTQWVQALVPYITRYAQQDPNHEMETDAWVRLIDQPNGLDLANRLLDAGLNRPWSAPKEGSRPLRNILGTRAVREPATLASIVRLVHDRGEVIDPRWAQAALSHYTSSRWVDDSRPKPLFDDRVHDYGPAKRKPMAFGHEKIQALSHEEITNLMALCQWKPGADLPARMFDILAARPINPGPEGIDADIEFFVRTGMLHQALIPNAQPSGLHRLDWTRYSHWFNNWLQDDAVFNKVITTDPKLHWPCLAIAAQIVAQTPDPEQQVRAKWFGRMAHQFPENAEQVLTALFDTFARSPGSWLDRRNEAAALDMIKFGAKPSEECLLLMANAVLGHAGSKDDDRQAQLVGFLVDAGVDLKSHGAKLIDGELLRELQTAPGITAAVLSRKAAIKAILEAGADVSSLDLGRSSRPLHEFVRTTASSVALDASTVAHASGPRVRRF